MSTSPSMQLITRKSEWSDSCWVWGREPEPPSAAHSAIVSASWITAQPESVTQVVSMISVPGS